MNLEGRGECLSMLDLCVSFALFIGYGPTLSMQFSFFVVVFLIELSVYKGIS